MEKARFNAVNFKVKPGNLEPGSERWKHLEQLSRAADERDLTLMLYSYEAKVHRNPERGSRYPPLVRADGTVEHDTFSAVHWPIWRKWLNRAYQLARASTKMDIPVVKVDLEHLQKNGQHPSYDDRAWNQFKKEHDLNAKVSAEKRGHYVKTNGLRDEYRTWYRKQLAEVAKRFKREMHEINPDLVLGIMPAQPKLPYEPFQKYLATKDVPAIMDTWDLYEGQGYLNSVPANQKRIKTMNPHNRFVTWFTPTSYRPEDITVQAYHAAMRADGYSIWHLSMLTDRSPETGIRARPQGYTAEDYWNAFGKANRQVRSDLASGKETPDSIPYRKPKPPRRPLDLSNVDVPELQPAGDGTGSPGTFTLRNQHTFHLFVEKGEPIMMNVKHLAGEAKPSPVQYVLLDKKKEEIHRGVTPRGESGNIRVNAPRAGTYAVVISAGEHRGWFDVRFENEHVGLKIQSRKLGDSVYLMQRGWTRRTFWLARTNPEGSGRVTLSTVGNGYVGAILNDRPPYTGNPAGKQGAKVFDLPDEREVHKLELLVPEHVPDAFYTEKFFIGVEGNVEPYLFDGPERRLRTTDK